MDTARPECAWQRLSMFLAHTKTISIFYHTVPEPGLLPYWGLALSDYCIALTFTIVLIVLR